MIESVSLRQERWRVEGGGEIDSVFVYKNMGLIWNVETRLDPGVPTVQHLQNKYKTNSSNFIRTKYRIFNLIYLMYLTKLKNCVVGINSNALLLKIRGPELKTLEWWISGLRLKPLFFLISSLNIACSPHEFKLQKS